MYLHGLFFACIVFADDIIEPTYHHRVFLNSSRLSPSLAHHRQSVIHSSQIKALGSLLLRFNSLRLWHNTLGRSARRDGSTPLLPHRRPCRVSAPLCSLYNDQWVSGFTVAAQNTLRQAVLIGKRNLVIENSFPAFTPNSEEYDASLMARFVVAIASALTMFTETSAIVGERKKKILVLVPDMSTIMVLNAVAKSTLSASDLELIQVSCTSLMTAPHEEQDSPAIVVLAGTIEHYDESRLKDALKWAESASVTVCINTCIGAYPPELDGFETAFAYLPYSLNSVTSEDVRDTYVLSRFFPDPWKIESVIITENEYDTQDIVSCEQRPDKEKLMEVLIKNSESRQQVLAALKSTFG